MGGSASTSAAAGGGGKIKTLHVTIIDNTGYEGGKGVQELVIVGKSKHLWLSGRKKIEENFEMDLNASATEQVSHRNC